ncbi:MAG: hypothetical protein ACOVT5_13425, partial [Armatimonadaceae bacterium]
NGDHPSEDQNRVSPLELAQQLEAIARQWRDSIHHSTRMQEWRHRYQSRGIRGLNPPGEAPGANLSTVAPGIAGRIIALALDNPTNGCQRISQIITESGFPISHVSVQAILNKNNLGHRNARIRALECEVLAGTIALSPQGAQWIESINPSFAERESDPTAPYTMVSMGHTAVSRIPGIGRVHLHAGIEIWSLQAFVVAAPDTQPEWAISVLHNDILPEARKLRRKVEVVRTTDDRTFTGPDVHIFPIYLELNEIKHEVRETPDGHTRRFLAILLEDFVKKSRKRSYTTLERYQFELDHWIANYNKNMSLPGWPNLGESPATRLGIWRDATLGPGKNTAAQNPESSA